MTHDTTHSCPKNGCGKRVPRHQFACRKHWYEISSEVRFWINSAFRSRDGASHREAMVAAIAELNPDRETAEA